MTITHQADLPARQDEHYQVPTFQLPFLTMALAIFAQLGLVFFVLTVVGVPLIVVTAGIPLLLAAIPGTRWWANLHRVLIGRINGVEIERPYRKPPVPGIVNYLRTALTDPATWRDLAWLFVNATAGFAMLLLSSALFLGSIFYLIYPFLYAVTPQEVFGTPFGFFELHNVAQAFVVWPAAVLSFALWWNAGRPLARLSARMSAALLGPTENSRLALRVQEVEATRAESVDTQAAEIRRIERDLHDGAQARLAALSMNLGLAETLVERDPATAAQLLTEARESASQALTELRDLVRGIHPPVLADRGLDGAVRALALACPLDVDVTIDLPGRPAAPVESATYFAIAEALANLVKHSAATKAWIQISYEDGKIHVLVGDDGIGGAEITEGGGLHGVQRRLAVFDGTLSVLSPGGGPTSVVMDVPCELTSTP